MMATVAAIFGLVRTMPNYIAAALAAFVFTVIFLVWDRAVDDPQVRRMAREGYVQQVKLDAANAKLAEITRQHQAAKDALEALNARVALVEAGRAAFDAAREREIENYERALALAGRSCRLTRPDIDWLRKP